MEPKIFADGIKYIEKSEKAPAWMLASLSIDIETFKRFLDDNHRNSRYMKLDIKLSKKGTPYIELNTWKPEKPGFMKKPDDLPALTREQVEQIQTLRNNHNDAFEASLASIDDIDPNQVKF